MCQAPAQPYTQRRPRESPLFRLIRDHRQEVRAAWGERFEKHYGPWKSHWDRVLERFLRCGDLHFGFARVRCEDCGDERLLPHSCKCAGLCPSCESKRRAAWAEHVREVVLPDVPHAMLVFTLPICLRKIFSRDHARLGALSRIAYCCVRDFFTEHFPSIDGYPHVVTAIQTHGELINLNVHLHSLVSIGVTDRHGTFHPAPEDLDFSLVEEMFRRRVLGFLREEDLISEGFFHRISRWSPSGFSADASVRIAAGDHEGLERIGAYILRPPISLQRLEYNPEGETAIYRGKFNRRLGRNFEVLDPKELLARLLVLLPEPYEIRLRYYGAASTTWRRKKPEDATAAERDESPEAEPPATFARRSRKHWARMLKRIHHCDPLVCRRCGGRMRVIAFIEDHAVIEKILRHLRLWDPPRAPPSPDDEHGYRIDCDPAYDQATPHDLFEE